MLDTLYYYLVPSMWFWSVSWSTNCPVFFSFFLVDQRKKCPVSGNFWSVSGNFWSTKKKFNWPKKILVYQKEIWSTKNSQRLTKNSPRLDNFFFGWPKKCEIDRTIGRPIVRSFSHFFGSTKKNLSSLREFLVSLW